jgi:hypothetical protein
MMATVATEARFFMFRRFATSAVLVVCACIYVLAAERATFILTDGERKSGPVVFHGDNHENMINGYYNLGVDGGRDLSFAVDQVAVIDFVGGQPPTEELAKLGTGQMLVLRNGVTQEGRLINLIGGDTLIWENMAKQQQRYGITDVSRVYLNPASARTAFNYTAPPAPAPAPAATARQGQRQNPGQSSTRAGGNGNQRDARDRGDDSRDIVVQMDARQGWVDAGITVNRDDRLVFVTSVATRGLLGRIGNGPSFPIDTEDPITMRSSGRLMLSVSDTQRRGNREPLSVRVSQAAEQPRDRR